MRKIYFCLLSSLLVLYSDAQAPYIATAGGDGLGQYGYLEKDAVTFSRLERNTYDNIAYLSARWWITDNDNSNTSGKEFIYHVYDGPDWVNGVGWQCGGDNYPSKRTKDFNSIDFYPEWTAGCDCYVSVCAKFCDDSYAPASFNGTTTDGAVGFNERHFQVVDVDTTLHSSTAEYITDAGGICQTENPNNVAGSFTLDAGALTGISLSTLILKNNGSALEGTDIPNTALNIFYEPATGSEIFGDGNETLGGVLTGDWDGNAGDNIFGSNTLNIPMNGKIRVYILLCAYNSPAAVGKLINLGIINDGIFLSPEINTFSKLRINAGSISQRNIVLPVRFLSFTGSRSKGIVNLKWTAGSTGIFSKFIIQQSFDAVNFADAGTKPCSEFLFQSNNYQFALATTATFFRIAAISNNGILNYSNIVRIQNRTEGFKLLNNPVRNEILLESYLSSASKFHLRLFNLAGELLINQFLQINVGVNRIHLMKNYSSQLLFLTLTNRNGGDYNLKVFCH
jgi:hypothetical protein